MKAINARVLWNCDNCGKTTIHTVKGHSRWETEYGVECYNRVRVCEYCGKSLFTVELGCVDWFLVHDENNNLRKQIELLQAASSIDKT
jgi:hypothetical protein